MFRFLIQKSNFDFSKFRSFGCFSMDKLSLYVTFLKALISFILNKKSAFYLHATELNLYQGYIDNNSFETVFNK
jgi:hypothetical protein